MKQFFKKFKEKKGEGLGKATYDGFAFLLVLIVIVCMIALFNTVRSNIQKTKQSVDNVNAAIIENAAASGANIEFEVIDGVIVKKTTSTTP